MKNEDALDKSIEKMQETMKELERKMDEYEATKEEIKEFETGFELVVFERYEQPQMSLVPLLFPAILILILSICTLVFGIAAVLTVLTAIYALGMLVVIPAMFLSEDAGIGFAYTGIGIFLTVLNFMFNSTPM